MKNSRIVSAVLALLTIAFQSATAETYTVNSSSDNVVANACANHTSNCSLRGAITAANTNPGSTIVFALVEFCPVSGCAINLLTPLPDISAPMSIGPAGHMIQRSSSASTDFRIFNVTATGTVTLTGLTIKGGKLGIANGAGIQKLNGGTLNVINCTVRDNTGFSDGGAITNSSAGTVNVTNCTLTNNSVTRDGFATGKGGNGGGIANLGGGAVNVTNTTITGNASTEDGGGIYNLNGVLTVRDTLLADNHATTNHSSFGGGGGISHRSGTADIINSTLTGNSITGTGGGIFNLATMKVTNCTINGNTATGGSGGIINRGGGIYESPSAVSIQVKSTIIAENTATDAGPDVEGTFSSAGFNLIGNRTGSTGFTAPTDQTGASKGTAIDPKFDPNGLQNNGGPTKTIALQAISPAIDNGSSAGLSGNLTTDQRGSGFPRTVNDPAFSGATGGDGTDIGAFEVQAARLANISTRLPVQTGDNVLIGGFIITGTQPKKVIVRAIGPSLPFANKLANPTLELFGPSGPIDSNDNWVDSPNKQAIIDSTVPPGNDLESAIVATLPANKNGYTAIVRGVNGGTGIGVVEAFDLDQSVDSKLANISTRGFVQTGDDVLIAGTFILGTIPKQVLVRAIGPSLPIADKMANPTLELRNQNGDLIDANDNWVDSPNKQAISDTTIPPGNDFESAIIQVLPANGASYTAILRGVNDTTGIAVVEIYGLQ